MSLLFGDKKRPQYAKGGVDLTFLLFVLVLLVFGLVMMFSASYAYAYYYDGNSFHYITRQLIFAIMGLGAMAFFASWDYHIWHRFAWLSLAVSVVLLILVFTQPSVNDAHRWIWIGSQSFQPSEIAKFSLVLVFAHMISINYDKMKTFRYGILPFGVILVLLAGLIMPEPHLSATVLVVLLGAVMIFVGGPGLKWFGLAALGGGAWQVWP